jgi:hypothetical protein
MIQKISPIPSLPKRGTGKYPPKSRKNQKKDQPQEGLVKRSIYERLSLCLMARLTTGLVGATSCIHGRVIESQHVSIGASMCIVAGHAYNTAGSIHCRATC